MTTKEQSFDGILVHQIRGPLPRPDRSEPHIDALYFLQSGKDRFNPCSQLFNRVLATELLCKSLIALGCPPRTVKQHQSRIDDLCKNLSPEDRCILRIIMHSRIRLAFLIDSPGGFAHRAYQVQRCVDVVKENAGDVYAFGGNEVSSAAAEIFMQADKGKRYLMRNSQLMFHLSNLAAAVSPLSTSDDKLWTIEQREEAWEAMNAMLIREVREETRKEIIDRLKAAVDREQTIPDRSITFTGEEAAYFGFAELPRSSKRTHRHIKMRTKFEETFGISRKTYSRTMMDGFFQNTDFPSPIS